MLKLRVGQRVRVGGSCGCIMTVQSVSGDDAVLVTDNSTFYYHVGDCSLVPYKDYEQLTLF